MELEILCRKHAVTSEISTDRKKILDITNKWVWAIQVLAHITDEDYTKKEEIREKSYADKPLGMVAYIVANLYRSRIMKKLKARVNLIKDENMVIIEYPNIMKSTYHVIEEAEVCSTGGRIYPSRTEYEKSLASKHMINRGEEKIEETKEEEGKKKKKKKNKKKKHKVIETDEEIGSTSAIITDDELPRGKPTETDEELPLAKEGVMQ